MYNLYNKGVEKMTTQKFRIETLIAELRQALDYENISRASMVAHELDDQIELFFDGVTPVLNAFKNINDDFKAISRKIDNENFLRTRE